MAVDTPLKGALFALVVYLLTFVISIFVALIIYIMYRIIHRGKETAIRAKQSEPVKRTD